MVACTVAGTDSDRLFLSFPRGNSVGCNQHRATPTMESERRKPLLGRCLGAGFHCVFRRLFSVLLLTADNRRLHQQPATVARFRALGTETRRSHCEFPVFLCPCSERVIYAVTYFPVSSTRLAMLSCSAITLTGSCFARRRTIAIWVRSMSPSATSAITFFAAASSFANAPSR
jgi:hypothetical protein